MSIKDTTGYFGGGTDPSVSGTDRSTVEGGTSSYDSWNDKQCTNNGVTCEVSSCAHYCDGQKCNANVIHVGNVSANTSYDTRCDTYKEKKY